MNEYSDYVSELGVLLGRYLGGIDSAERFMRKFMSLRLRLIDSGAKPADGQGQWEPDDDGVVRDIWGQLFFDFEEFAPDYYYGRDRSAREPYEIEEPEFRRRQVELRAPQMRSNFGADIVPDIVPDARYLDQRRAIGHELMHVLEDYIDNRIATDRYVDEVVRIRDTCDELDISSTVFDAIFWEALGIEPASDTSTHSREAVRHRLDQLRNEFGR